MSQDNLTTQYVSSTYQRLLQLSDNGNYLTDGTGSIVNILPVTASYVLNGGGTGTPGAPVNSIQYNAGGGNFGGSSNLTYNGSDLNITGSILMSGSSTITGVKSVDFDILQDPTLVAQQEGRLFWNSNTKTLQLDLEQNFHTDLNQQLLVRIVNPYNFALPIGTVVYITGSQGSRPTVATASWTGDQTSAATLGFTAKSINQNNNGYVITRGILDGLNTNGFSVGDQLYLSSSGQFTNIPPDAPLHEVRLGKVLVSSPTVGSIYVDIMNGYELTELHDVRTNGYSDGDLLIRSASLWTNSKQLSGSYILSGSLTTNDGVSVINLTASFISASSITGSLFGTSSWANRATTSTNIIPVLVTNNSDYNIALVDNNSPTPIRAAAPVFTYNPTTKILQVPTVSGSLIGTASYASNAGTVSLGGSNGSVQINSSGVLGGDTNFTYTSGKVNVPDFRINGSLQLTSIVLVNDANTPYTCIGKETTILCDTTNSSIDLDLSAFGAYNGITVIIKDVGYNAFTNNINFTGASIENGNFSKIDINGATITMIFDKDYFNTFWIVGSYNG